MKSLLLILGVLAACSEGYKFLVVFPFPVRSMCLLGEGFVKHLLDDGHEVTYISPFPLKNKTANLNQIHVTNTLKSLDAFDMTIAGMLEHGVTAVDVTDGQMFGFNTASLLFADDNFRTFLKDRSLKFDAVIADLFENEVVAGLTALYDCPMIWSYSIGADPAVLRLIDHMPNPTYIGNFMSLNVPPFTLTQRVQELWARAKWLYYKKTYTQPKEEALYRETFKPLLEQRGRELPHYEQLIYNASLIFGNDHSIGGNIPSLPGNFKFVAGQHIAEHHKPLPKDLQQIMDSAKHGVVYFSMGSAFKSETMPKQLINDLLKMLGELKHTVFWKFEAELNNVPANVHILHWAPQPSILAHPNLLCYIAHGGQLSSIEALHFGVPVIGVPVAFDQYLNVRKAVALGYAIYVKLDYNLAESLRAAVHTMATDPVYSRKAKEASRLFHDRLSPPAAELVHYTGLVVRTRGAPHLRSPALHVPYYQILYLDLIAIIVSAIIVVVSLFKFVIGKVFVGKNSERINVKKYN